MTNKDLAATPHEHIHNKLTKQPPQDTDNPFFSPHSHGAVYCYLRVTGDMTYRGDGSKVRRIQERGRCLNLHHENRKNPRHEACADSAAGTGSRAVAHARTGTQGGRGDCGAGAHAPWQGPSSLEGEGQSGAEEHRQGRGIGAVSSEPAEAVGSQPWLAT